MAYLQHLSTVQYVNIDLEKRGRRVSRDKERSLFYTTTPALNLKVAHILCF